MAMGRAVVASPIGGIPEVVHHGTTGILCPTGDSAAYADAVGRLLADPGIRGRLGAAGRRLILERHSVVAMGDETEKFYLRLAAAKGVPAG